MDVCSLKRGFLSAASLAPILLVAVVAAGVGPAAAQEGGLLLIDPQHGFRVRYPVGWQARTIFESDDGPAYVIRRRVAVTAHDGAAIEIDVWLKDSEQSFVDWSRSVEGWEGSGPANAEIAGQPAYVRSMVGDCGVATVLSTYLSRPGRVVKISLASTGGRPALIAYRDLLSSFAWLEAGPTGQKPAVLPDLEAMVPLECGTGICPSTCWGGCTFAAGEEGCCGYHAIPRWQCARSCEGDQIGEFQGNCVWWGAYTRPDVGALASGNAENWAISVRNTGQLPVDTQPRVGDIVVHPGSSYNHVAYVVWAAPDGSAYQMSDMGWCSDCGPAPEETKLREVDEDDEFIHCAGDPATPRDDWTFASCPFGWTPSKGWSASELSEAGWRLDPDEDPFLLSPVLSLPADGYARLAVTMSSEASAAQGRVYFATGSGFDEAQSVAFAVNGDGLAHTYTVTLSTHPAWAETITRLRFDPVDAGNDDGSEDSVVVQRIRLLPGPAPHLTAHLYLPLVVRYEASNRPPYVPAGPQPADGAIDQPVDLVLSWIGGDPDGDAVAYDLYLDVASAGPPLTLVCDDVLDTSCSPGALLTDTHYVWQVVASDEHGAEVLGPSWAFTTATTTTTSCQELIANGGFELGSGWEIPGTAYPAAYAEAEVHGGSQSMQIGIVDPGDEVRSYSSARQLVVVPSDTVSLTLGFWLYGLSYELAGADAQYVMVLDEDGARLETLLWQHEDNRTWVEQAYDLSGYVSQTIKLHFGVYNDGLGGVTGLYVDDVSLQACK